MPSFKTIAIAAILVACVHGRQAVAGSIDYAVNCGTARDSIRVGPFDYRKRVFVGSKDMHRIVDKFHYTTDLVHAAMRGDPKDSDRVLGNLDYTLHVFPNHPGALFAMGMYQARLRQVVSYFEYRRLLSNVSALTAECYFVRAMNFVPDDENVYNAYGIFLHRIGKYKQAIEEFKKVVKLRPKSGKAHYNLGLAYFSLHEYPQAVAQAREAEKLGHPIGPLRSRLQREGAWK